MIDLPYIHLRTQSSYSLAEGALKIKKIVKLAKENNMPSIALTDNNNLFGALEFAIECSENGVHPIIGLTINILDYQENEKISQISLLVKNEKGYKNLLYISSISYIKQDNVVGIKWASDNVTHFLQMLRTYHDRFNFIENIFRRLF